MVRPDLDAVRLVIYVEHALLDLLVDLLGRVDERFLHVGRRPSGRLHEHQVVLAGKRLALLLLDLTTRVQVTGRGGMLGTQILSLDLPFLLPLVANQHYNHVGVGMLAGILQPCGQVVERFPTGDVVDQESTSGTPVIGPGD